MEGWQDGAGKSTRMALKSLILMFTLKNDQKVSKQLKNLHRVGVEPKSVVCQLFPPCLRHCQCAFVWSFRSEWEQGKQGALSPLRLHQPTCDHFGLFGGILLNEESPRFSSLSTTNPSACCWPKVQSLIKILTHS